MKIDMGMEFEEMGDKDFVSCEARVKKECEECSGCLELEDKITNSNEKCKLLELEIEKKKNETEWLEGKLGFVELLKLKMEDEVRLLKQRNEDLEKSIRNGERVFSKEEKRMTGVIDLTELNEEVRLLKQRNEDLEKGIRNGERVFSKEEKRMTGVIDLTELNDEEDKVTQLMIENKVLECEKKKAESEVEVWKVKCKGLEMQVVELQNKTLREMTNKGLDLPELASEKLSEEGRQIHVRASVVQTELENKETEDKNGTDTPVMNTPIKLYASAEGVKGSHQGDFKFMQGSQVRKRLGFVEEVSPYMNFSPSTPSGRPPFGPTDDCDGDNNVHIPQLHISDPDIKGRKNICSSTDIGSGNISYKNELTSKDRCTRVLEHQGDDDDDEDITCYSGSTPQLLTPKRRRVLKIVTSDGESDNDDMPHNMDFNPNSNHVCDTDSMDKLKKPMPRRRLRRLGNCEEEGVPGKCTHESTKNKNIFGIPKYETVEDDSSSEGESLGGFIVSSSDMSDIDTSSDCVDTSNDDGPFSSDDTSGEIKNSSDSSMGHNEIISGLSRDSTHKMKWDFEAEMLADFGKLAEVCMMAVCALYRQQTSEEKSFKATIVNNRRGFSQPHAYSGSALAEFLTDGNPQGDVKKSVKELLQFNPKGVQLCEDLARHYSKQLFAIYQNKEDPFFRPP